MSNGCKCEYLSEKCGGEAVVCPSCHIAVQSKLSCQSTAHRIDNAMFLAELEKATECIREAISMREARIRADMAECMGRDVENVVAHDSALAGWRSVVADIGIKSAGLDGQ